MHSYVIAKKSKEVIIFGQPKKKMNEYRNSREFLPLSISFSGDLRGPKSWHRNFPDRLPCQYRLQ